MKTSMMQAEVPKMRGCEQIMGVVPDRRHCFLTIAVFRHTPAGVIFYMGITRTIAPSCRISRPCGWRAHYLAFDQGGSQGG